MASKQLQKDDRGPLEEIKNYLKKREKDNQKFEGRMPSKKKKKKKRNKQMKETVQELKV